MTQRYLNSGFDPSGLTDVFDELPLWSAPFGLKLLDCVEYKQGISAIDIGCGTGFPLIELAMRLGDSSTVYGIDPWKDAIEKARRKIEYYGITNIKLIEGVAESIPLKDNSIDLITSNNGINNVQNIDTVLAECSRIAKQGGQFIQTMNTDKSMFEFYDLLETIFSELGMTQEIEAMHQHIEAKRPPIDRIVTMLQKHGFFINDLEHDCFDYRFADGKAMLHHHFIRLAFMDSWEKLMPENKVDEVLCLAESRMNEQAKQSGGFKLTIPYVMIYAKKR